MLPKLVSGIATPQFSWTMDSLIAQAKVSSILAGWSGDALLAFVFFTDLKTEGEILVTYVSPESRGQGIMTQLLKSLFLAKTLIKTWFLEVHPQNIAALRTYEGLGFKTTGIRKNYYSDRSDALILALHR
ncbi:MAG: GNAT family N-acetyltransferase [Bdellovibrionota bacterium]